MVSNKNILLALICMLLCGIAAVAQTPEMLNRELRIELFGTRSPWNRSAADIIAANQWEKVTPDGKGKRTVTFDNGVLSLGCVLEEIKFQERDKKVYLLTLIYANKGEAANQMVDVTKETGKKQGRKTADVPQRKDTGALQRSLTELLGKPQTRSIADTGDSSKQRKVQCWVYKGETVFVMNAGGSADGIVQIMSRAQFETLSGPKTGKRIIQDYKGKRHVKTDKDLQDVWIYDIPRGTEGKKENSGAACLERVFRLYGVTTINQEKLGKAIGEATTTLSSKLAACAADAGAEFGLNVVRVNMSFIHIVENIDKGYPLLWAMHSYPEYESRAEEYTRKRARYQSARKWHEQMAHYGKTPLKGNRDAANRCVCLIVGYNKQTNEIAVSNSFGGRGELWWISWNDANTVDGELKLLGLVPGRQDARMSNK